MSGDGIPAEWQDQIDNLAWRFGVRHHVAVLAMRRNDGHAGKAARQLRLLEPLPEPEPEPEPEQPQLPSHRSPPAMLTPSPAAQGRGSPPLRLSPGRPAGAARAALKDTVASLEAALSALKDCDSAASALEQLEELQAAVGTQRSRLALELHGDPTVVAVGPTGGASFLELWTAKEELDALYNIDEYEFFDHALHEVWVSIGALVSEGRGSWSDADPEQLSATAAGLQSQSLWAAGVIAFDLIIEKAEAQNESHPLRSSLQVSYNGRGMCQSRLGNAEAALADLDRAGALVCQGALQS